MNTLSLLEPFPIEDGSDLPINGFVVQTQSEVCEAPQCGHAHMHRHKFFEVHWLSKGEATLFADFHAYRLNAGTLVFISPGQIYKWQLHAEMQLVIIGFKPELFTANGQNLFPLLPNLPFYDTSQPPFVSLAGEYPAHIDYLLTTLVNRQNGASARRESLLLAYLNVVLTEVQMISQATVTPPPQTAATELTRAFQLLVESHYGKRKQVQAYAELLGVTVNHLVETVRATTGTTPGQWIQRRLLLEIKRLLAYTPRPIEDIAESFAFKNASQFSRWFKHLTGVTPGQFRRDIATPRDEFPSSS